MFTTIAAVFGVISVALSVYHWQLARQGAARSRRAVPAPPAGEPAASSLAPAAPTARRRCDSGIFPRCAPGGASESGELGELSRVRMTATRRRLARRGIYATVDFGGAGARPEQRGQRAAERVIGGSDRQPPRRGCRAALDAIVVGASGEGLAAASSLLQAGLRVLLVDTLGSAGEAVAALANDAGPRLLASGGERMPWVGGHRVIGIGERDDDTLELCAERATWYTANIIIALPEPWRVVGVAREPACASAA
ncbi:MAG TPA: hypothetical protein VNN80_13400 [Polyangiaceae bacterium]|nr:hypothetical protein [Polyangiaceae bacterium]